MRSNINLDLLSEIDGKRKSMESDILLKHAPKMYDYEMWLESSESGSGGSITDHKERMMGINQNKWNEQRTLAFLIFTVSLAFLAFILDIIAVI